MRKVFVTHFVIELYGSTDPDSFTKEYFPELECKEVLSETTLPWFKSVRFLGSRKPSDLFFSRSLVMPVTTNEEPSSSRPTSSKSYSPCPEHNSILSADSSFQCSIVPYSSGNPSVECTEGIIHFFKDITPTNLDDKKHDLPPRICILNIPTKLSLQDVLQFIAAYSSTLQSIRVVKKNANQNSYMAILDFIQSSDAVQFFKDKNMQSFNSLEPGDVAQCVFVQDVEVIKDSIIYSPQKGDANADSIMEGKKSISGNGNTVTELPMCIVCLEKMDESVQGVLTILCNHSFHQSCLEQWYDSTCPVCRYSCTPPTKETSSCLECQATEDVWICLICGYVGCGRYVDGHAKNHFLETDHTYAMNLENSRVWDYAGDNYVHRIIQDKTEGKPVEFRNENDEKDEQEKLDSVTLEYTYLLTTQLEAQREYFESIIAANERQSSAIITDISSDLATTKKRIVVVLADLKEERRLKQSLASKMQKMQEKLAEANAKLADEQELNKGLRSDSEQWRQQLDLANKRLEVTSKVNASQIADLNQQLSDLMLHLDSMNKCEKLDQNDVEGSHVIITEPTTSTTPHKRSSHKKK